MTNESVTISLFQFNQMCKEIEELRAYKKQQQEKTGRWIYKLEDWNKWTCSECGFSKRTDVHVKLRFNFCPNCGCQMRGDNNGNE